MRLQQHRLHLRGPPSRHGACRDSKPERGKPVSPMSCRAHLEGQQRCNVCPDGHREQSTYKFAAILASTGVTAMAISAVYFRFTWHIRDGADFPTLEAAATLLLTFGGVVRAALSHDQCTYLYVCIDERCLVCYLGALLVSCPVALNSCSLHFAGGYGDVGAVGAQGAVA